MSLVSSSRSVQGSLDVDVSRGRVYTTNHDDIKLYGFSGQGDVYSPSGLEYLNRIPVVRSWDGSKVSPDDLHLYGGGDSVLMLDAGREDTVFKLDIERGVVTGGSRVHTRFEGGRGLEGSGYDDVSFKVGRFDYNNAGQYAQYDKCVVAINSNHVMRVCLGDGSLVGSKAYERGPGFTCVATDVRGNVVVGDKGGGVRLFPDVGKRAAKFFSGLGDPVTDIKVSSSGCIVATTPFYIVYLPEFVLGSEVSHVVGKVSPEIIKHLGLGGCAVRHAQFSPDEKALVFSIGNFVFHWGVRDLVKGEQTFEVYEAEGTVVHHKVVGGQFVLADKSVVVFKLK